jgi:hypothetical protein
MSLGDEQKPKQKTPSGSNNSNPQAGVSFSGLTKADIDDAIKALDQEKQKLATEIKKEQEKIANNKSDPFQEVKDSVAKEQDKSLQELEQTTTEDLENTYDKVVDKSDASGQTTKTQTENSATVSNRQDQSDDQPQETEENQTEGETNETNSTGENRQEEGDQVSQGGTEVSGLEPSPDYADYTQTGDTNSDNANKLKVQSMRSVAADRSAELERDRQENKQSRLQAGEDREKDKIFDQQWDDYQNGKTDIAPTADSINDQYTKNEAEKNSQKNQAENPNQLDNNSSSSNFDTNPVDTGNPDTQTSANETSPAEGSADSYMPTSVPGINDGVAKPDDTSTDYMNYAPTGDPTVDARNQAQVDRMREQRAENDKHTVQDQETNGQESDNSEGDLGYNPESNLVKNVIKKGEGRADRVSREDRELNDKAEKARGDNDHLSKKEQDEAVRDRKKELIDKRRHDHVMQGAKRQKDGTMGTSEFQNLKNRTRLAGDQLGRIGNKLNTVKNIAQDPAGSAKQAAERKIQEMAKKAAEKAAKKAAEAAAKVAARIAQAAAQAISAVVSAVGSVLGPFAIPIIVGVILFVAVFSVILVDAYCTPRPVVRGVIEYALTGDAKNLVQVADAVPIAGGLIAKAADAVATHSEIYSKIFYGQGGICPDKNPDRCVQAPGGAGGSTKGEFGVASGLVTAAQCTKLKEYKAFIDEAANDFGLPSSFIAGIMSHETDVGLISLYKPTGGCNGRADTGGRGHGIGQIDQASGAFGKIPSQPPRQFPEGTGLVKDGKPLVDKKGKQLVWNDCRDNIYYIAYHLDEVRKACGKDLNARGAVNSKEYLRYLANGYNRWCGGVKDEVSGRVAIRDGLVYGVSVVNRAADAEKCFGGGAAPAPTPGQPAKAITDQVDQILNQLAIRTDDNIPLKEAIIKQVEDNLATQNNDYTKPVEESQSANIISKLLGGVDVQAANATPGNFVYNGEDKTVAGFVDSGKVKDVIKAVSPTRDILKVQIEKKVLEPNTLKGLISIVNSNKFESVQISSAYRAGDNTTNGHGSGQKFDIDSVSYKGKTYTHQSANDGDAGAIEAFYELAKSAKDTGILSWIITGGKIFEKISTDSYLAGTKIIRDDKSKPIYGGIHENHYDLRFSPSGDVKSGSGSSPSSATTSDGCCGSGTTGGATGSIGTATGDGTLSKGGDFTPEIRAYLDVLAEEEVPKEIHLKKESYFAGNQIPATFTEVQAKAGHPGNVGGKGSNVGRYQFNQGDYNDAKSADSRIKDFGPEGQDLVALYKLKYRKVIGPLTSGNIEDAFEAGSAEWESIVGKNDTILTGGSDRKGQKSPTGRTMAKQVAYYKQRLAVYKKAGSITPVNQLADIDQSTNILNSLTNNINVNAQDSTVEETFDPGELTDEIFDAGEVINETVITDYSDTTNSTPILLTNPATPTTPTTPTKPATPATPTATPDTSAATPATNPACVCGDSNGSSATGNVSQNNTNIINSDADQKYMATATSQAKWGKLASPLITIIHYTASGTATYDSINKLFFDAIAKGPGKSGNQGWAHYMIDKDGKSAQFMTEDRKVSGSDGNTGFYFKNGQQLNVNDHAVQYEVHYDAGAGYNQTISDAQLLSLAKTVKKSGFQPSQIYTHWGVQPYDRDDSKDWIPNDGTISPKLIQFVKYAEWATEDGAAKTIAKQIIKQNIENAIKVQETLKGKSLKGVTIKSNQNPLNKLQAGLTALNAIGFDENLKPSSDIELASTYKSDDQVKDSSQDQATVLNGLVNGVEVNAEGDQGDTVQSEDNTATNQDVLNGLVNGVEVRAQSATTIADKRKELKALFKKGFIAQTINVQKDDAIGYESGYDDNMIGFMYDLYFKVGITWIGGPYSWGRSGGDHGKGDAMDAWAFGYVSEIGAKNLPIKGYTGPVGLYPASGGPPGSGGNTVDPRLFRMIDAGSENPAIKQKTIDIFKKVVDAAYSTGLVKQYGKGQSYGAKGFPNVYGHDELAKVVGTTKMFGHSSGSVLPLAGSPLNNGHLTHIHISIVDEEYVKYTGVNGVSAASGSGNCNTECPKPTTGKADISETNLASLGDGLTNFIESYGLNSLGAIDVNAAFGSKPSSYSTIKNDPKYLAFLKEIADTRGYEQYRDAGKNTEMETALRAMVAASSGKLKVQNTYRSYDSQVGTYFASSGVDNPIKKYWSPTLTPTELASVKAAYLARGTVSAPPGYSQHSTGLGVDFFPVENSYEGTAGYTFLKASAETFGFKESYPKGSNKGAGYEPWHWQFVGNTKYKLSTPLTSFQIGSSAGGSSKCP